MRKLSLILLLGLVPIAAKGDDIKVEPLPDLLSVQVRFQHPVPTDFCNQTDCTKGTNPASYQLYEIVNADNENIKAEPRGVTNVEVKGCTGNGCSLFVLHLSTRLNSGSRYLLKLNGISATAALTRFEMSNEAKVTTSYINAERRDEIAIKAEVPITPTASFRIMRTVSDIRKNAAGIPDLFPQPKPMPGKVMAATPDFIIGIKLASKLRQGVSYDLSSIGVVDTSDSHNPIAATGVIELPGVPEPPDDPKIDVTLSSLAARHQKTVFDFVGNFAPLKRIALGEEEQTPRNQDTGELNNLTLSQQKRASHRYSTSWAIEPTANIDVGLRSTKSNNSITLGLPFTKDFLGGNVRTFTKADTKIPVYAGWQSASLFHLAYMKFSVGPRLETDRTFKRINMLGEMRFDFNFTRFGDAGTIGGRRANLKSDLGDQAKFVEIKWGFKMIPYVSFDFGGHVNDETVTNSDKKVSVFVPRHRIFRTYLGAVPTFQWKALGVLQTLSLDESVVFMASRETIGFTTDDGAQLRSIRGFHPHTLIKWNIAIDPGGHYNLVTTYENGRLAPNFEYLNKTTAGFRIVY
jgi:hypothetical protein